MKGYTFVIKFLWSILFILGQVFAQSEQKLYRSYNKNITVDIINNFNGKQEPILHGPPGGYVNNIILPPHDPNTVITADAFYFKGLFKNSDNGFTWDILNHGLIYNALPLEVSVYGLAIDPVFPDTMFINFRHENSLKIYRTLDYGNNWQEILSDSLGYTAITAFNGRVYAYATNKLLLSENAGDNWEIININLPNVHKLFIVPENPDEIYAGTIGDGIYYSSDAGNSFNQLAFPNRKIKDFDVLSFSSSRYITLLTTNDSLYISNDGGITWIPRCIGIPEPYILYNVIKISPDNPNILYVATDYGIYKSSDMGLNWHAINNGLNIPTMIFPEPEPVFVLALAIDSNNANTIYAGTDRMGLFKSINGGQDWYLLGIPSTYVFDISVSSQNPGLVYCGASEGFYRRRHERWKHTTLWGGITSTNKTIAVSPIDSNLVIANHANSILMPVIYKSTDGGANWDLKLMLFDGSNILDIIFDPVFPNRVYGVWCWGLSGMLISNDSGNNWNISNFGDTLIFNQPGSMVKKPLVINPQNANEFYLLELGGRVHKSIDRAQTWNTIRAEQDTAHFALAIDPFDTSNIYLATYSVCKSSNGGDSWSRTNLNRWALDLAFDENSGYLYVATYGGGVFYTTDGGQTWDSLPKPDNPYLNSIDIGEGDSYSIIYAGSFCSSVFEWTRHTTLIVEPELYIQLTNRFELQQNYPNPFNAETIISYFLPEKTYVELTVYDVLGKKIIDLFSGYQFSGTHQIKLDASKLSSGIYFYVLRAGLTKLARKALLIK
jgi:photosystem II stability/assembly factor-like uncharacterized protein